MENTFTLSRNQRRLIERFLKKPMGSILNQEDLIANLEKCLENLETNLILMSDAYKYSHPSFYPDGLTKLVSYLESRGGIFSETVMFGLQYIMKKYLVGSVLTENMVLEADEKLNGVNGVFNGDKVFPTEKWMALVKKYDGCVPLEIRAVPEGTVVDVKNVLAMLESTDEEFAWIVGFIETLILQVWYPITVASLSREVMKLVKHYLKITGTDESLVNLIAEYILNDFGMRGVSSMESASIGGAAHLINSSGSDNIMGSVLLQDFYAATKMKGKSIRATEHSIMTLKGEAGELEMMMRILDKCPTGYVACVSDSYNIFKACSQYWGTELREKVLSRDGVLVIRPDSGDPKRTLKEVFNILFDKFGYTVNKAGFKVLPKQVRVIQGDGVNIHSIKEIYEMLVEEGIAAENLVYGMGGKLLQSNIDRDQLNFAVKACFAIINGEEVEIVKAPTEMDKDGNIKVSFKKSKKGDLKLIMFEGKHITVSKKDAKYLDYPDCLIPVFRNGVLLVDYTLDSVVERLAA